MYLIAVLELEDTKNLPVVEESLEDFLMKQLEDNSRVAAYTLRRDTDETLPENLRELADEIECSLEGELE